jgi:hypothetical protein
MLTINDKVRLLAPFDAAFPGTFAIVREDSDCGQRAPRLEVPVAR